LQCGCSAEAQEDVEDVEAVVVAHLHAEAEEEVLKME